MSKSSFPNSVRTNHWNVETTLVFLPSFKGMHYSTNSPSTHHSPPQPILYLYKYVLYIIISYNIVLLKLKECIYLTRIYVLGRVRDDHSRSGMVKAVFTKLGRRKLRERKKASSFCCHLLLFFAYPISHQPYLYIIYMLHSFLMKYYLLDLKK